MQMDQSCIAIDFGSSFSRVSVFRNGHVEILENEQGSKSTPSYVAFTDKFPLVGDRAKNQGGINPKNTVHAIKRYLGRSNIEVVCHAMYKQFRFGYIAETEMPRLRVRSKGREQTKTAEEVTAILLAKMKYLAEIYLQKPVKSAVITVPAQFSSTQRQAICDAARIAELSPILINESIAAALAYLFEFRRELCYGTKNLLIFDFGGGRLDVAVVTASNGELRVRASEGTMNIGGDDLDALLITEFAWQYYKKNNQDIAAHPNAFHRLRETCERVKKQLSFSATAVFTIEELHGYKNFSSSIKRERFEYLCNLILHQAMDYVQKAMEQSDLCKEEIDEVILVGGSSRIPKVQELLSRYFNGKPVNKAINPDEAVVIGAAVYSALAQDPRTVRGISLRLQAPFDLGFAFYKDCMQHLIRKNALLPVSSSRVMEYLLDSKCYSKKQDTFPINIYEGRQEFKYWNNLLLSLEVSLKPSWDHCLDYRVEFKMESDRILTITITDLNTNIKRSGNYLLGETPYDSTQLERMTANIQQYRRDEEEEYARIEAKYSLESYIHQILGKLDHSKISPVAKQNVQFECGTVSKWLDSAPQANSTMYMDKLEELRRHCEQILSGNRANALSSQSFKSTSNRALTNPFKACVPRKRKT